MLIHKKGNLLDMADAGQFDIIVQGCNCFNTMGGGIAREIRDRYPDAAAVDMATKKGDYLKLGTWTSATVTSGKAPFLIVNAYTQYEMSKGEDVFEYIAFQLILQKLAHQFGEYRIGMPYIGMGLAGGNPELIMPMIDWFADEVTARGGSVSLVEFGK